MVVLIYSSYAPGRDSSSRCRSDLCASEVAKDCWVDAVPHCVIFASIRMWVYGYIGICVYGHSYMGIWVYRYIDVFMY